MDLLVGDFLCCTPLKYIKTDFIKNLTWNEQELLLNNTINNPLLRQYPISHSYQVTFLKELIRHFEKDSIEVHDNIYNKYCELLQQENNETYFFKHYKILDKIITLKESLKLISEGTTGLQTWEAAKVLSEWCIFNSDFLKNKNIVELGSGVGLVGIAINRFCRPKHLWLTDCHSKVLDLLKENVNTNCEINHENIDVMELSWEDISAEKFSNVIKHTDVVLAADVVFDPSIFELLENCFCTFLKGNKNCHILLACTVRNEETLNNFIELLHDRKFLVNELKCPTMQYFNLPPSAVINLYKITSNN